MPLDTTWMDLEIITLNEVNQKEKDKYISLIHGLQKRYKSTHLQKEDRLSTVENNKVTKGASKAWGRQIVWDGQRHIATYKINNKDLLHITGSYTQYLVIIYKG